MTDLQSTPPTIHRSQLSPDHIFSLSRLTLCESFTYAHNRSDPASEGALRFQCNYGIGFAMVVPPF